MCDSTNRALCTCIAFAGRNSYSEYSLRSAQPCTAMYCMTRRLIANALLTTNHRYRISHICSTIVRLFLLLRSYSTACIHSHSTVCVSVRAPASTHATAYRQTIRVCRFVRVRDADLTSAATVTAQQHHTADADAAHNRTHCNTFSCSHRNNENRLKKEK